MRESTACLRSRWMRCPKCLNMVLPPLREMLPYSARRESMGQERTTWSISSGNGVRKSAAAVRKMVG